MAKQSLAGLIGTNDATVLALNQQVTGMLATTGIVPPDAVTTQMGGMVPGMMMGTGMGGMVPGMGMTGMMPGGGLMASTTMPLATPMGMSMGGLGMRNSMLASGMGMPMPGMMGSSMMAGSMMGGMMGGSMMGGTLAPPGATIIPQQMMGSTAITPMAMTGSLVGPFGGGMGLSIR